MKKIKIQLAEDQEKILKTMGYVLLSLSLLVLIFVVIGRWIPVVKDSWFYGAINIFNSFEGANPWLRSLSYILCIWSMAYVFRRLLTYSFSWLKRGRAIISLLSSFLKYVAMIVIVFFILAAFGVDTTALIAGLGILSLIVGLAVQPLLQDIIAGVFIVFEKTFDVGDVVVVDGFRGTVTEIGIRTTKLMDAGGDVKVINNSDIRTLVNMTSELSYAISDFDIEYGESLEKVEKVIEESLDLMKEKIPSIKSGPFYKGVVELGVNGVKLRLVAECREDEKFQTQRDMNRQIKLIFDANGIDIPFAQVTVHTAKEKERPTVSGDTEDFVKEQNQLSTSMGDDEEN